jgi:hypothetical protein
VQSHRFQAKSKTIGYDEPLLDGFHYCGSTLFSRTRTAVQVDGMIYFMPLPAEYLLIDRKADPVLAEAIGWAKTLRNLPEEKRLLTLGRGIRRMYNAARPFEETRKRLRAFPKQRMYLGETLARQAGLCRHMALLFKVLADEAGLKASVHCGILQDRDGKGQFHMWNQVKYTDNDGNAQERVFDVTQWLWPPVTDPIAGRHYRTYGGKSYYPKSLTPPTEEGEATSPAS